MVGSKLQTRFWVTAVMGLLVGSLFFRVSVQAQAYYDPDSGQYVGQAPQPGYGPGYPPNPAGPQPGYGGYPAPGGYPPSQFAPGNVPPFGPGYPNPTPGYGAPGSPPFYPSDVSSFGGAPGYPNPASGYGAPTSPPPDGSAMMAVATVAGLKFSYNPQAGDYASLQSRSVGRWEQFPVTLHLTYPEGMSDTNKQAVKAAVAAWQRVVDITLVDQPDQAKIELNWASDLEDNDELGETNVKATHVDSMGRTVIDKALIRMMDPETYGNVFPNTLKSAVMHQLGHALGINAHSDNNRDLMAEPVYKRPPNKMVAKAVRSLASKTLGQFLDLPIYAEDAPRKQVIRLPVEKISKRDLNTLFRVYN